MRPIRKSSCALGRYIVQFFLLFLLGAVFDKLMEVTGSARALAEAITNRVGNGQTALAVVIACGGLTYGGVSLFVVAFAVHPIVAALFVRAGHPKRFIPAALAWDRDRRWPCHFKGIDP